MRLLYLITLTLLLSSAALAEDATNNDIYMVPAFTDPVTICQVPTDPEPFAVEVSAFFTSLFDTSQWPARWYCGYWSSFHGWLYLISDASIWLAYFLIPLVLGYFLIKRRAEIPFRPVLLLFIGFILACGFTHLLDAVMFWWPAYKFSALLRFGTAIISWGTVLALVKVTPQALSFKSPQSLKKEIDAQTGELKRLNEQLRLEIESKTRAEANLQQLNEELEQKVLLRTKALNEALSDVSKSNVLLTSLQEAAQIGVWTFDSNTGDLYWSDEVYRIHEIEPGTPVDVEKAINFYHPDYIPTIQKALEDALQKNKRYDLELKLVTAKANEIWVRAIVIPEKNGKLKGMFQDIHSVKTIEMRLLEREENLSAIIENNKGAVWSIDEKYNYTVFNGKFEKTIKNATGIAPKIGETAFYSEYSPEVVTYWRNKYTEVLESGEQISWLEETQNRKKEREILEISLHPILDESKAIKGVTGISRDVTTAKLYEERIERANALLEARVSERTRELEDANIQLQFTNKELSAFSYSVSHDLRTPLRSIHGFSQALLEDYGDTLDENANQYLARIQASSIRMGKLIDDLLSLSKISKKPVSREHIDFTELSKNVFNNMESKAILNIETNLTCHADPGLVMIVMENLINNAIKYSAEAVSPTIHISKKAVDGQEVFSIIDNGVGFNEEYANKLFSPFQRLHDAKRFEGTGIGLAIVKRIITKHGGTIWAESIEGQGATFSFTLKPSEL